MTLYRAPLQEMKFLLDHVVDAQRLCSIPAFRGINSDQVFSSVSEASRLIEAKLSPLRLSSDAGCRYEDETVKTPPGYKEFYKRYVDEGWSAIEHPVQYGGAGQSYLLGRMVEEMLCSADAAFALYPALTHGCYAAIEACASEQLKATYLPKLATGEWAGTLCLTESHAGSDLTSIGTRAIPQADGRFRIEGSKMFITSGEHDLTNNIVHFVLARVPGAPLGVKGLSTFIVPKFLPDEDDNLGTRNAFRCTSIERKMGMHGSATATVSFEGATGWLAGNLNEGFKNVDALMNREWISASLQGLGLCELSTQIAIRYARERQQGRAPNGRAQIIEYPDVRRMLLRMKAVTEGARSMAYETALNVDIARHHPDKDVRAEAQDWVNLSAPLLKSFCTDAAFQLGSLSIQVHGGHGYICEQGVEQIVRDAKMLSLYQGSSGRQAAELVGRKIKLDGGRLPNRFFAAVERDIAAVQAGDETIVRPLREALSALHSATTQIQKTGSNACDAAFGADDYVHAFAVTMIGWHWLRIDRAARRYQNGYAKAKRVTAQYFATRILTKVPVICSNALLGADSMLELEAEYF